MMNLFQFSSPNQSLNRENSLELNQIEKLGNCKICSDKATGIHYGVGTCEGCKGFYKRSLNKYKSYYCFNKNKHNCKINTNDRIKCKSCRFKKCLNEGMSIKSLILKNIFFYLKKITIVQIGIRLGRIPKSMKSKSRSGENDDDEDDNDDDCIIIDGI
jgi:hypothetical protein